MKISEKTQAILGTAAGIAIAASLVCVSLACDEKMGLGEQEPSETLPVVTEASRVSVDTSESIPEFVPSEPKRPVCEVPALLTGANGLTAYASELELLSEIVEIEAGGESEECRAAVCGVILNRLASGIWGDSLTDVIFWNGEFDSADYLGTFEVQVTTSEIVREVWENGSDVPADVLFFRDGGYHDWCGAVDRFSVGAMYFSSSVWCEVD